jgi:hypothetical protein
MIEMGLRKEQKEVIWDNPTNIDGTFLPHQKGAISATFTSDWYLREKTETKLGEWLKKTTV